MIQPRVDDQGDVGDVVTAKLCNTKAEQFFSKGLNQVTVLKALLDYHCINYEQREPCVDTTQRPNGPMLRSAKQLPLFGFNKKDIGNMHD